VRGEGGHRRIVAYCTVTRQDSGAPAEAAVKAFVSRALPDYMVPADVVFLDELPMTPNGKVDPARLPDSRSRPVTEYRPPDNDLERDVAAALADVLKVERVGVEDNFFERGGNSLLAVQARSRLLPLFGGRLSLVDIFRYPTVRTLVSALTDGAAADEDLAAVRRAAGQRATALARRQARRRRAGQEGA